jgi:hypothetical protein
MGARAKLPAVLHEMMQLLKRLDGINRYRFRDDRELLDAWKLARDVGWPGSAQDTGEWYRRGEAGSVGGGR